LPALPLEELDGRAARRHPQDARPGANADLRFEERPFVAVLTVRAFSDRLGEGSTESIGDFIDGAFQRLEERRPQALIIDVRDNGGGMDHLGMMLFAHLATRPFDYYRGIYLRRTSFIFPMPATPVPSLERWDIRPDEAGRLAVNRHPNLGRQSPRAPVYMGPVFVLMNGGSFSSTSEFLALSHFHRRATFIGEEASGGYYGNNAGEFTTLTLPNSRLEVRLPLFRYDVAVDGAPPDRGVPPDHVVRPCIEDLIDGRDPVLSLALALAARGRS
jgi:C-terminal processing protease CtpA/Prc